MKTVRTYSGWMAALTVTVTLTLTLMAVEKYLSESGTGLWHLAQKATYLQPQRKPRTNSIGIVLEMDATLVDSSGHVPNRIADRSSELRRGGGVRSEVSGLLRRPPEPASGAVLREPLSAEDFVSLPLTQGSSNLSLLMQSMDAALESPLRMVSLDRQSLDGLPDGQSEVPPVENAASGRALRSPAEMSNRFPAPTQLIHELNQLWETLAESKAISVPLPEENVGQHYVGSHVGVSSQLLPVAGWLKRTQSLIELLVTEQGLENPQSREVLDELMQLSAQGIPLGEQLEDYQLAQSVIQTAYSVQRRVEVWNAIQACLDDTSIQLSQPQTTTMARSQMSTALAEVESLLADSSDTKAWRDFLLMDELTDWSKQQEDVWRTGNRLATKFLSRVYSVRLNDPQREFLKDEKITRLISLMTAWNRDPIDYRHLLASIEQVEQSAQPRMVSTVADSIQLLRTSEKPSQRGLAETLNTHYRNANLRLTVSRELIEKFLPEGHFEVRPVRQTILGAHTAGDSAIQTQLSVKLHPDPNSWNIELGVEGDLVSNTRSSKGPAVFHNTGVAQVQSKRYLKLGPRGYTISSNPTQVASQDFLNRMSTDFDGLPIIGEFARLIAREQFNQKRGIAKRLTQRKIAQETDLELDRKLDENLKHFEQQLQQRILGPLDRLSLDPMVVSMSTTQERLAIRYRLAHERQLTAFTPRPRAPTGSLVSFQVHQSALNNTLERLGLSGRSWTLAELYQHLGGLFRADLTPPEDVPADITVRFADLSPISFQMVDGRLRLQLRIAEFNREEGLNLRNFVVTSTYIPVAEGLDAGLIRDPEGVIEIQGKHLAMRDRLALRVIFAKVFVSQPRISLISPQWSQDPRAEGLAVSQLEIRDGWLAVAISNSDSHLATELAERSKHAKMQMR